MDNPLTAKKSPVDEAPSNPLVWVQFRVNTWPQRSAYAGVQMIIANDQTKLWLTDYMGVRCVVVEDPSYKFPARVPMENVAAFGVPE
ncbi:MAG: hypothetical protein JWM82_3351 [Myxococcales bacterium]|nr:hypothetical protein [Myxococcales bacterium]